MSYIVYIGIDDTDITGSPGTGNLSKRMARHLESLGLGISTGITRNQLLVDSRIRYTSHNSSLCIALKTEKLIQSLYQPCIDFMKKHFQEGSDPGLCICEEGEINSEIIEFGFSAQNVVLNKADADAIAKNNNLFLVELGGTGEGVIGALAAVALRAEGNSGRFIDLRGIRDLNGFVSVYEILKLTDIHSVQDLQGNTLDNSEIVNSMGWVRPPLVNHLPVFKLMPETGESNKRIWFSLEAKKRMERKYKKERIQR